MTKCNQFLFSLLNCLLSVWGYKPEDDENLYQSFAKAMDKAVNFYDTAEVFKGIF